MSNITKQLLLLAVLLLPWASKLNAQCDPGVSMCSISFEMTDSYGDGWNDCTISVYQDTILRGTVTLSSGSSGSATVEICSNDSVRLVWFGESSYPNYAGEAGFSVYNGDGTTVIANQTGSSFSSNSDIITFMPICPTCIVPSSLTALNVTTDEISITWVDNNNTGASYRIDYWKSGEDTNTVTTSSTSYTFTDLDANSNYNFAVVAVCSESDQSTPLTGSFRTACSGSTCTLSLVLGSSSTYTDPFNYYGGPASVELFQAGSSIGAYSNTTTVDVCGTDPIVVKYNNCGYSWGDYYDSYANITIQDGGGLTVYQGGMGDTLCVITTPCPTCIPPTNLTATSTLDEIEFSWTPRSDNNQFILYLNGTAVAFNVTDTFYTFSNLDANTNYLIGVQNVCSSDDTSAIVSMNFRTACGEIVLPFSDDFDNYENGAWPPCWHRLIKHGTDPSVNSQYHASGTQSMFLLAQNDTNLFVTPSAIPTSGDNIFVRYKAYVDHSSWDVPTTWWIKAGVMTDTSDVSTFIMLDSIGYHDCNWSFEEYEFNTSSLDPDASYWVAWMFTSNTSSRRGAIDDVFISELPSCLRPMGTSVSNVTAHTVDLSWNNMGSDSYTIYYGTVNDINDPSIESITSYDTAITLTGLVGQTHYYAWITSVCSGAESESNTFSSFTTLISCPVITGLTVIDSLTTTDGATIVWTPGGSETEWAVTLDSLEVNIVNDTFFTFTGLEALSGHTVYVRAICEEDDTSAYSSVSFATACDVATCTMTVNMTDSYGDGWNGNYINFYQAGAMVGSATLGNGSSGVAYVEVCSSAPVELRFSQGSYASEMGGTVTDGGDETVFTIENMGGYSNGAVLASVNTPCPSCLPVTGIIAYHVDSTSISYSWDVVYGNSYLISFNGDDFVENSTGTYTATGLTPNTQYSFSIMTVCDLDDTSLVRTFIQKTTCLMMSLPYIESFESYNSGDMATCWNVVHSYTVNSNSIYPMVTFDGYNSSKALSFCSNGPCMAATSAIPNDGLQGDQYHISFYAKLSSYSGYATAGVMTNVNYDTTYTSLTTIANDGEWHRYDIYTSGMNPTETYYFALRYDGNSAYESYMLNIDSLIIDIDDGCHYPNNLTTTATTSSITVHWTNDGTTANFIVSYQLANSSSLIYTIPSSNDSVVLNNLYGSSNYLIRVGNICSNGDTLWASTSALTECGILSLPYFEDFSAYATDVMPPCWDYNSSAITHFDGGLFFRSNTGPGFPAVLPQFNQPINKVEIQFRTKVGPVSQGDAILVGVADASGNFIQWLDTLTDPNQSRSAFVEMYYRYDQYLGSGSRIALGRLYSGSDWALIDDINVSQIPTCSPADSIIGHNLYDPDSSYFTWSNPDGLTTFQVFVDTVTADTTTIPVAALTSITANSYLIPSGFLNGGGKYKFFIRTDCGSDHSSWKVVTFGSGEFIMSQSGTDTVTSCGLVIYDNGGPIAGYYASTNSSLVIYPAGTSNRLQVYGAYLSLYNDGNSTLTIYDGVGNGSTVLYQTSYSGPTTMYDSIVSLPIATSSTGPLTVNFSAGGYVNPGYELYVRCIPIASCDDPTYIQATNITSDQASLNWYGNASSYNIYYRTVGSTAWNMVNSTTENVTLNGLTGATSYEVQIRAICSDIDSSNLSTTYTFTTNCEIVNITSATPLLEEFEGSQVPPVCYQLIYGSTANADDNPVIFDPAAAHSGSKGLRFSSANVTSSANYNQTLITPELSCDSDMVVLFYVRASQGTEQFRVGYSTTDNSTASFTWQAPVTIGATWLGYRLDIPAAARYVAINYFSGSPRHYLYVDSLVVAVNNGNQGCFGPVVTNISSTTNSITVNYLTLGQVEAGIVEGSTWNDATVAVQIPNGTSYTFDHLFSDNSQLIDTTVYTIGLRSICGNDYSDWVTSTISTRALTCNTPTDVVVNIIDGSSVSITWSSNGASNWEVSYSNGSNEQTVTTTNPYVTLYSLTAGVTYTVKVRAICGQTQSNWSLTSTFTPTDCPAPIGLATSNVTSNSALITWNAGSASQWEIAYGFANSFDVNSATHMTTSDNSFQLTGLTHSSNYTWAVRSICADGATSVWSAHVNFTTLQNDGIDVNDNVANVAIYPNPTSDVTTISVSGITGDVNITIVDLNGRTVMTNQMSCNGDCNKTLEVNSLAKGSYFVRINGENGLNMVKKLIVK